jgi:hypothetical protein
MAKKYNKGRKQKPNYSKRGIRKADAELGAELGAELSPDSQLRGLEVSSNLCSECLRSVKRK